MVKKLALFSIVILGLSACQPAPESHSTTGGEPSPKPNSSEGQTAPTVAAPSVKAELAAGKTLIFTLTDAGLVSQINEKMNRHDTVIIQSGKLNSDNQSSENWCEFASQNGFANRGDRFEVVAADYQEKVYLGSERAQIKVSSSLFLECNEGRMEQNEFSLDDYKKIFGSMVKVELSK